MEDSVSSATNVILGIIIIFISLCLLVGFYFYNERMSNPDKIDDEKDEEIRNITYKMQLLAYNTDNKRIDADYVLKQGNSIMQSGVIKSGVDEYFSNAIVNITYSLYLDNEDYYYSKSDCYNEYPDTIQKCSTKLSKIGKVYINGIKIKEDMFQLIINVEDGIVKNPLLCVGYKNLINVSIENIQKTQKINRIENRYDICYLIGQNLQNSIYYYNVNFQQLEGEKELYFIVLDEGYDENFSPTYETDTEIPDIYFSSQI